MGKTKQTTVKVDKAQYEELARIREKEGIPVSVSLRRAIRTWLNQRQEKRKQNSGTAPPSQGQRDER